MSRRRRQQNGVGGGGGDRRSDTRFSTKVGDLRIGIVLPKFKFKATQSCEAMT